MKSIAQILFLCLFSMVVVFTACEENEVTGPDFLDIKITSIKLNTNEMSINEGNTKELVATIYPDDVENKNVKWSSDAPEIATVDKNGKVTGMKVGVANVKVTTEDGFNTDVCMVTVTGLIKATNISFSDENITLKKGQKKKLVPVLVPEAITEEIEWESSCPDIVSVDNQGNINALRAGVSTIIVKTVLSNLTAQCVVTVNDVIEEVSYTAENIKIGDYFYSDGTVSDGGLRKLHLVTGVQVWETTKPQPVSDKTLIGVVYNTNSDRISDDEKQNGWTAGQVVAIKAITNDYTYAWGELAFDEELPNINVGSSHGDAFNGLNGDIKGYKYTQLLKSKTGFAFEIISEITAYPDNTSGWYIPSSGQWLDIYRAVFGLDLNMQTLGIKNNNGLPRWEGNARIAKTVMDAFNNKLLFDAGQAYWSSSEKDKDVAFRFAVNHQTAKNIVNIEAQKKNVTARIRPVLSFKIKR